MTSQTKIVLVSAFPPGRQSLNEYGLHLANEFAARPDVSEVVIIADKLDVPQNELDLGPKVRVRRVWQFNSSKSVVNILRALIQERASGVVWNLQIASFGDKEIPAALGLMGPALARLTGTPSGVIAHNLVSGVDLESTHLQGQQWRQILVRLGGAAVTRALLQANYMTVTLRSYLDALESKYPGKSVHLVPHGTFDTVKIETQTFDLRPKRVVTMGKFGTYKRLETLINSFKKLTENPDFADYELIIGGTDHPSTPGYMASVAKDNKNTPSIQFHGYVAEEDIPDFFSDARLSVFDYSSTTGSSGVLHQSASYGAVPVFPKIGDFVDVCQDEGLEGFNYSPNDSESMTAAMTRALENPDQAQKTADINRQAAVEMPLADVVAFHVEKLLNKKAPRAKMLGTNAAA